MVTIKEIAWLAGILEGEASFHIAKVTPVIRVKMTDLDTIEKVKKIFKCENQIYTHEPERGKTLYITTAYSTLAIEWMMTIYPLMSIRRKSKIREILDFWKSYENKPSYIFQKGHKFRQLALLKKNFRDLNVSEAEIEKLVANLKK